MKKINILTRFTLCFSILFSVIIGNAESSAESFQMTIAHISDTHAQIESETRSFVIDGETVFVNVGGFPAMVAKVRELRRKEENLLMLHAGDVFQGTLYFQKYQGLADLDFLHMIELDAFVLGNHEFDKGADVLAAFAQQAEFPILGANIDVSNEPKLSHIVLPYTIKTYGDETVGIIGLTLKDIPDISQPGPTIQFYDPLPIAQNLIDELIALGINKIVLLTHLGFQDDLELAENLSGVDVIVGGHSHTLLGNYENIGMTSYLHYPVIAKSKDNEDVLIAHSWSKNRGIGVLDIVFDESGTIIDHSGETIILVIDDLNQMKYVDENNQTLPMDKSQYETLQTNIRQMDNLTLVEEAPNAKEVLMGYSASIKDLFQQVVGDAEADLLNVPLPGFRHSSGVIVENGSQIGQIVADGMLWKAKSVGLNVSFALQNAGGVRIDIPKGEVTIGEVYELLPFGNTLVALELSGKKIKEMLEQVISRAIFTRNYGSFPHVSGIQFAATVDSNSVSVHDMKIQDDSGEWNALEEDKTYRFVTNNYLAAGKGGYSILKDTDGYRYDTGFVDAEAFIDYLNETGSLKPIEEKRVELMYKR
jgi:5'-nucleotidase